MSNMLKFLREHGEKPRREFNAQSGRILFIDTFTNHYCDQPYVYPTGSFAVNAAMAYPNYTRGHQLLHVAHLDNKKPLTIALVGKGVCFDSGGMNIKTGSHMSGMKFDKMGALTAMAVGMALMKEKNPHHNYLIIVPFVENMVGPHALCPDDILTYQVGEKELRVEIDNTDAEGRLILADGLLEAQLRNADLIIDIATLTGAVVSVLGEGAVGVFGNDEELQNLMVKTFNSVQKESAFSLPIFKSHEKLLEAQNKDIADIVNSGRSWQAGASTAAAFLRKFIYKPDVKWIHLDMAGADNVKGKASDLVAKAVLKFIKGFVP